MILDANTLTPGETLSADVCIVGGGAAGITLAMELRGSGLDVILLESGGSELEADTQELYRGKLTGLGDFRLDVWRLRQWGGTTNHWAGWSRPLRPRDFEVRDWMPHSGWPIAWEDIEPWYDRASDLLELGVRDYTVGPLAELGGRAILFPDDGPLRTEMFQFSPPTRFGARYGPDLEVAPDVRVYHHANLVDIQLDTATDAVDHLVCATLLGVDFTVQADRFVLALGGVENARVLLAANSQRPNGVANATDQVGRWFMEHPHYRTSAAVVSEHALDLDLYAPHLTTVIEPDGEEKSHRFQAAIALSEEVRESEQLPDWTAIFFESIPEDAGIEPLRPAAIGPSLFRCPGESRFYRLTLRTEQRPIPTSRITLHPNGTDALGMPVPVLNWQIDPEDGRALVRGLEILGAELGRHCLGRLWIPQAGGSIAAELSPAGHHMGATRMGDDPDTSVVDGNCRCHEVPNLYIAGSSVFTTGSSSNPTLTIVALAVRLADHLVSTR